MQDLRVGSTICDSAVTEKVATFLQRWDLVDGHGHGKGRPAFFERGVSVTPTAQLTRKVRNKTRPTATTAHSDTMDRFLRPERI